MGVGTKPRIRDKKEKRTGGKSSLKVDFFVALGYRLRLQVLRLGFDILGNRKLRVCKTFRWIGTFIRNRNPKTENWAINHKYATTAARFGSTA